MFNKRQRPGMRWLKRIVYAIVGLGLAVLLGATAVTWLSLPDAGATVSVPSLRDPVTVHRDGHGIPTIVAGNTGDAYFALGYVHAQDRMFQMDFMRRLGAGQLSEVAGSATLPIDRLMRTLGLYRLAERSAAALGPDERGAMEAYAAGVNAYLDSGLLPSAPEFALLAYAPEPWRPADSLVWGRLMGMQLSNNWRDELVRAALAGRLPGDRLRELWPEPGDERPLNLPVKTGSLAPAAAVAARLLAALPDGKAGGASNVWALSGRHTASGKPLLANDPHLGFTTPVLWYLARIETPDLSLSGATAPGVPFHVIAHNGRIAWGFTTTHSDTQDLFIEQVDPDDPTRYRTPDGPRPFETRSETLRVRGGPDETLDIRSTRHGPVISDLVGGAGPGTVLALAATALDADDQTAAAIRKLGHAADWDDFLDALSNFGAPQQNVFYADTDGNIGFAVPGKVPLRKAGDGFAPVPGWTGTHDWSGYVAFQSLPRTLNPPSGRIFNANNRIVPPDYPVFLAREWPGGYRARRIEARLEALGAATTDDMTAIQYDAVSLAARDLLPLLTAIQPEGLMARQAVAMLRGWNGDMAASRPEPLIFLEWLRQLNRRLFADELGPEFGRFWGLRPALVESVLTRRPHWCDDKLTDAVEDCADSVADALDDALAILGERYGDDPRGWLWGNAHKADFPHPVFRVVPGLSRLFGHRVATSGSDHSVKRGTSRISREATPHRHVHGAGLRVVFDLAALDRSRFVIATGQSGNPMSAHFSDMLPRWQAARFVEIAPSRDILENAAATLTLVPR